MFVTFAFPVRRRFAGSFHTNGAEVANHFADEVPLERVSRQRQALKMTCLDCSPFPIIAERTVMMSPAKADTTPAVSMGPRYPILAIADSPSAARPSSELCPNFVNPQILRPQTAIYCRTVHHDVALAHVTSVSREEDIKAGCV
jgi:hypothetical protein